MCMSSQLAWLLCTCLWLIFLNTCIGLIIAWGAVNLDFCARTCLWLMNNCMNNHPNGFVHVYWTRNRMGSTLTLASVHIIYLPTNLSAACLPVCHFVCIPTCLSVCLYVCIYPSIHPSLPLSVCLSVCLSILSIYLSIYLFYLPT